MNHSKIIPIKDLPTPQTHFRSDPIQIHMHKKRRKLSLDPKVVLTYPILPFLTLFYSTPFSNRSFWLKSERNIWNDKLRKNTQKWFFVSKNWDTNLAINNSASACFIVCSKFMCALIMKMDLGNEMEECHISTKEFIDKSTDLCR